MMKWNIIDKQNKSKRFREIINKREIKKRKKDCLKYKLLIGAKQIKDRGKYYKQLRQLLPVMVLKTSFCSQVGVDCLKYEAVVWTRNTVSNDIQTILLSKLFKFSICDFDCGNGYFDNQCSKNEWSQMLKRSVQIRPGQN